MPTVRGILRRGLTVEGLKQFISSQGSSKSVVVMDWDKIWSFNRKVIDPLSIRYSGVEKVDAVTVLFEDQIGQDDSISVALHPKNSDLGTRSVKIGSKLMIDQTDAKLIQPSTEVTFITWGNASILSVEKNGDKVTTVKAKLNLDNKDFKKTLKITWLECHSTVPALLIYYDNIIQKPVLGKDDDFKKYINTNSKFVVEAYVDEAMKNLKRGDFIQIQRKGFFICDEPYDESTIAFTGKPKPIHLISIPDGSSDINIFPERVQQWKRQNVFKDTSVDFKTNSVSIDTSIRAQGDLVRKLKTDKASKESIKAEVDKLLALKAEFKNATNKDWTPDFKPTGSIAKASSESNSSCQLDLNIRAQGDLVRKLKADKASKESVKVEVDKLLALKAEFKNAYNKDWTPDFKPTESIAKALSESNSSCQLDLNIRAQGDLVRKLKADKASKESIKAEVDKLLAFKAEFKNAYNKDWTPEFKPTDSIAKSSSENISSCKLDFNIRAQGDLVRKLKADKASKESVKVEVDKLLALKVEFKNAYNKDWTPDFKLTESTSSPVNVKSDCKSQDVKQEESQCLEKIAYKSQVDCQASNSKVLSNLLIGTQMDHSLAYKPLLKPVSSSDWTENSVCVEQSSVSVSTLDSNDLDEQIRKQGDVVRKLKADKADKKFIDEAVRSLLLLKDQYKQNLGVEWKPDTASVAPKKEKAQKKEKLKQVQVSQPRIDDTGDSKVKKQTRLGIEVKKSDRYSDWYKEVITKAEMIEYYDVSGCYILRPWAYYIWESIQNFFDARIKSIGVQNCYFPMFISKSALETEKTHISDFAPEVAWVTRSGGADFAEPIAIRPTSETVMYPSYAKWIQSCRDLPIRLNQWCNVVRWEFKQPTPFLRSREFLWQEGHSAFATKEEALDEVYTILGFYADVYEKLLAIPVVRGRKTEKEKFAGGDMTTTCEAYVGVNGRGIQGATSHFLGQNFSKMFELTFEDPDNAGQKLFAYQNSWGLSTRTIGAMIMIHGDDKGLVLPPKVAAIQVVIVACGITVNTSEEDKCKLLTACGDLAKRLQTEANLRTRFDSSQHHSPGWKFNHWELKGVPVRIEFGPKDLAKGEFVSVRRDTGEKQSFQLVNAVQQLKSLLDSIHQNLFERARKLRDDHMIVTESWHTLLDKLDQRFIIMAPFCGEPSCEDQIKRDSAKEDVEAAGEGPLMGAKSLCIPLDQPKQVAHDATCIHPNCTRKPQFYTLFGRSY